MGFSRQEYWSGLPFPSPVDHILSELYTMTCLSWMALHGMAHSFIELGPKLWSMWSDWLVFCDCGFQSVCPHLPVASPLRLDMGYLLSLQHYAATAPASPVLLGILCPWMWGISQLQISHHQEDPPKRAWCHPENSPACSLRSCRVWMFFLRTVRL